jgi:hypothetical protein
MVQVSTNGMKAQLLHNSMTTGSILLGLALLIFIVLVLLHPYLVAQQPEELTPYEQLAATKEMLLGEIRILDFDHETGKLPTDLYETQRQALVAETAQVMQRLDTLPAPDDDEADLDVDERIEAAIAALRRSGSATKKSKKKKRKKVAPATAVVNTNGRFCTQCGQAVNQEDKFCAHCGHRLADSSQYSANSEA